MSKVLDNKLISLGPFHEIYIDGPEIWDSDEYGWSDMTADLSAGKAVGANAPTWSAWNGGVMDAYAFDAATMNEMWITFHPNHDIIEGSLYYPHIHWMPNTTSTGVVAWKVDICTAKGHNQAAFNTTPVTVDLADTVTSNSQYMHRIVEASTGIAMPEVDSLIMIRVYRDAADASDTFPDAVFGLTVDIHYRKGKFATKGKRPDFNLPD